MRIGRVVRNAPRRPESPPGIHLRTPSDPPPEAPCSKKQRACLVLMIVFHLCRAWQLNSKARDLALCLVRPKLIRASYDPEV
eukprot:1158248-Pelagomonas_calceolata.AAC.2